MSGTGRVVLQSGAGRRKSTWETSSRKFAVEEELKSESQDIKGLRVKRCPVPMSESLCGGGR